MERNSSPANRQKKEYIFGDFKCFAKPTFHTCNQIKTNKKTKKKKKKFPSSEKEQSKQSWQKKKATTNQPKETKWNYLNENWIKFLWRRVCAWLTRRCKSEPCSSQLYMSTIISLNEISTSKIIYTYVWTYNMFKCVNKVHKLLRWEKKKTEEAKMRIFKCNRTKCRHKLIFNTQSGKQGEWTKWASNVTKKWEIWSYGKKGIYATVDEKPYAKPIDATQSVDSFEPAILSVLYFFSLFAHSLCIALHCIIYW